MSELNNNVTNLNIIEKVNNCAGIPDYTNYIDLTNISNTYLKIGQGFSYVAPKPGIFIAKLYRKYSGYSTTVHVNGVFINSCDNYLSGEFSWVYTIPMDKGDLIEIGSNVEANKSNDYCYQLSNKKFIPFK